MAESVVVTPSKVTQGSLSSKEASLLRDVLTRHYGERVAPVSEYCQGFYDWSDAIKAKIARLKAGKEKDWSGDDLSQWEAVLSALSTIGLPVAKSSMLGRRIYGGEKLRTEMCPKHKGQWQGLDFHGECECQLTGWLPAESNKKKTHG